MIAEICGKMGGFNLNLSERMEDELTGNVFGNLRYLPFNKGLKQILIHSVYPLEIGDEIRKIYCDPWSENIEFWPYHKEGEIDLKITFPQMIIGIEVKYHSGLSSDEIDDKNAGSKDFENIEENQEEVLLSNDQLTRESRMLKDWGVGKKKILLLLGDEKACHSIYKDVKNKKKRIEEDVMFGYVTWQNVLLGLKDLQELSEFEQVIVQDLIDLLVRKDFDIFQNFTASTKIQPSLVWQFSKKYNYALFGEIFASVLFSSKEIKPKEKWLFNK